MLVVGVVLACVGMWVRLVEDCPIYVGSWYLPKFPV